MNAAVIVAIAMEEDFKNYLIVCEYLQIDPSCAYDPAWIGERVSNVLSEWQNCGDEKLFKKLDKKLKWFAKNYKTFAKSGFLGYGFVKQCQKLVAKGKLQLASGTVNEKYEKRELTQLNYDFYKKPNGKKKC